MRKSLAAACVLLTFALPVSGEDEPEAELEARMRAADQLLAKGAVEARPHIRHVFGLAHRLQDAGRAQDALRYYERALKVHPWALEHQLAYAKLLKAEGHTGKAEGRAELVAERAERFELIQGAHELLGEPLDVEVPALAAMEGRAHTLVLVPLGKCNPLLAKAVGEALGKTLPIPVVVRSLAVAVPPPGRDPATQVRGNLLGVLERVKAHPQASAKLAEAGVDLAPPEGLEDTLSLLVRVLGVLESPAAAARFERAVRNDLERSAQWDALALIGALERAASPLIQPNACVLGITEHDIYEGEANFMFGYRQWATAVMSYRRFMADFYGNEQPNRDRLMDRTMKQCLSSVGHLWHVPRCSDPRCARAYPNSLQEHDAKGSKLCGECGSGLEAALQRDVPRGR
jgi:predicted Zn-dependent protease